MESAPGMDFNLNSQENFKIGYEHLKSRVEYIFSNPKLKHDTWRVAYWCVKIRRSSVLKSGTRADIARLPASKGKNKARQQRTRVNDEGREVKRRRIKKTHTVAVIENDVDDVPPLAATTDHVQIRPVTQEQPNIRRSVQTQNIQVNNNVGNDFATAFSEVQEEFMEFSVASSQPQPRSALPSRKSRGPTQPGMCARCGLPVSNIHTCDVCKHNMHVFCGKPIGEEGYGQKIRCTPCQRALDA